MDTFFKKNYEHIVKQDKLLSSCKKKIGQDMKGPRCTPEWNDQDHLKKQQYNPQRR